MLLANAHPRARRSLRGRRVSLASRLGLAFACVAFACLAAAPTAAASTIALAWDECRPGGGAQVHVNACDSNLGAQEWFASLLLDAPLSGVIGLIAVIDFQHSAPSLPDWWALQPGGCRVGELDASALFADRPGCADPWAAAPGGATSLIQGINPTQPRGGANQMRLYYTAAVPSSQAVDWAAGTAYHAVRLRLTNARTTGAGACAGCSGAACLVLNGVEVQRLSGPDVVLSDGGGQNIVNWQPSGQDCATVPVLRTSWGRLRTLYR